MDTITNYYFQQGDVFSTGIIMGAIGVPFFILMYRSISDQNGPIDAEAKEEDEHKIMLQQYKKSNRCKKPFPPQQLILLARHTSDEWWKNEPNQKLFCIYTLQIYILLKNFNLTHHKLSHKSENWLIG